MRQTSKVLFLCAWLFLQSLPALGAGLEKSKWKLAVYMQADNDLAAHALEDLQEMVDGVAASGRVRVFVHLDLPGKDGLREFEVLPGYNLEELLGGAEILDEEGADQTERLRNFLLKTQKLAPFRHSMVVVWGHGEGWSSGPAQFGGLALDLFPPSRMGVEQIARVLEDTARESGAKTDLLVMDACLMQTVEAVYSLKNAASFLAGSAQIQDFEGLPYQSVLNFIQNDLEQLALGSDSDEPYYLAKELPYLFALNYEASGKYDKQTMSSVSGDELERVFLPSFEKALSAVNSKLSANPWQLFDLKSSLTLTPFFLGNSRDIGVFLSALEEFFYQAQEFETAKKIAHARRNLSYSVLSYAYGPNYFSSQSEMALGSFKAFGLWFPATKDEYLARIGQFKTSPLYRSRYFSAYGRFLKNLYMSSIF